MTGYALVITDMFIFFFLFVWFLKVLRPNSSVVNCMKEWRKTWEKLNCYKVETIGPGFFLLPERRNKHFDINCFQSQNGLVLLV